MSYMPDDVDQEMIDYDGWDLHKAIPTYPIGGAMFYKNGLYTDSYGFSPLIDKRAFKQFKIEMKNAINKENSPESLRKTFDNMSYFPINKEDYPIFSKCALVLLPFDKDSTYLLQIFLPNQEFVDALEPGNRRIVLENYDVIDKIGAEDEVIIVHDPFETPYNIAGIEELELTDDELANLGIMREGSGYRMIDEQFYDMEMGSMVHFTTNDRDSSNGWNPQHNKEVVRDFIGSRNYDTSRRYTYIRYPIWFDSSHVQPGQPMHYDGWPIAPGNPYPVITMHSFRRLKYNEKYDDYEPTRTAYILHDSHDDSLMMQRFGVDEIDFWNEDGFAPNIPMIPISILYGDMDDYNSQWSKYQFWYILTNDFIDKLPERYAEPLRKELDVINKVSSGEMSYEAACKGFDSESYLGVCRMESANIKDAMVYPNPYSGGALKLGFVLVKDCRLKVDMHNARGEYIGNLMPAADFGSGPGEFALNITEKPDPGVYLITITSDKGDQVVKKLIIR
ncbi:MAG: hypothetical protein ACLFQX_06360 [Candidatus Kapaibacterium sp.]